MTRPIWQLTPSEFHGTLVANGHRDDAWSMGGDAIAALLAQQTPIGPAVSFISAVTGAAYEFVPVQCAGDFVVIESATGAPVGFKTDSTITISDRHRRSGLGVELLLLAYEHAPWPLNPSLDVTEAGKRTLEKAHREAVRRAFEAGEPNFKRYSLI